MATPHRFRTKRNLWPYAGLAVVTRCCADQEFAGGKLRRRNRQPRTRGLKSQSQSDAQVDPQTSSHRCRSGGGTAPGPVRGLRGAWHQAGAGEGDSGARKIASIALRLWKKGELWDPTPVSGFPRRALAIPAALPQEEFTQPMAALSTFFRTSRAPAADPGPTPAGGPVWRSASAFRHQLQRDVSHLVLSWRLHAASLDQPYLSGGPRLPCF
jgi:hypothetical protein